MMKKIILLLLLFFISCASNCKLGHYPPIIESSKEYFDSSRNRKIPVEFYYTNNTQNCSNTKIVIFSHGYSGNQPNAYKEYSYLTNALAENGYFVVSIQHELSTDELLDFKGVPQIVRRPNWERGAENIKFVIENLKKDFPKLNYRKLTLAGHSNGGDMSVLFTEKNPEKVWKLITLDQRRYAFPRVSKPKIYSLRSSDQPADEGVLPTEDEQKKFGITIIKLPNTIHNDMDNDGTAEQKKEIVDYFLKFLKEN